MVSGDEVPIQKVEWARRRPCFGGHVIGAAAAVVGHFVYVISAGSIGLGGHQPAIGVQRHAVRVRQFHPLVGVGINQQIPVVDLSRVEPRIRPQHQEMIQQIGALGRQLLTAMAKAFPSLPLIAEDLGALTPEVEALRDDFGLAGMRIVQNAFWSGRSGDMPHNHPGRSVVYSGTHDNETTVQWWSSRNAAERARFKAYAGDGPVHEAMARIVLASPAALAVLPMQDILGLGKSARMNLPGTALGNWGWRMDPRALAGPVGKRLAARFRALVDASGRG